MNSVQKYPVRWQHAAAKGHVGEVPFVDGLSCLPAVFQPPATS